MRPAHELGVKDVRLSFRTYLLDTNILLAALNTPKRIPAEVVSILVATRNIVYFSVASLWEIGIKQSLNRNDFNFAPEDICRLAIETGFVELPILNEHCGGVATLPWHHRDPFDRMIITQTLSLPAYLLTSDEVLKKYSVDLVVYVPLK